MGGKSGREPEIPVETPENQRPEDRSERPSGRHQGGENEPFSRSHGSLSCDHQLPVRLEDDGYDCQCVPDPAI